MCDSRTDQATVARATSKDQVFIVADDVRIRVRVGCSWFAVSLFGGSIPCGENPACTARGSGALLQGVC